MKKIISRIMVLLVALAMGITFTSCTGSNSLTQEQVDKMVSEFKAPTIINATFTQNYALNVIDDRTFLQSFAVKVNDVVTIQIDFTANSIYYYGKKVSGQNVVEQLLVKEGSVYAYYTTTEARETVETDALAIAKVSELLSKLTRQTAGYVDAEAFTYSNTWIQDYVLLGSENVDYLDSEFFTYAYEKSKNGGLILTGDLKMVGYFGDMGTFEFGVDDTHEGSNIKVETNEDGQVVSFEQTLNNHLDMALFDPPAPLDLEGTRKLVATYGEALTKKTEIAQNLVTTGTIVLPEVANGTISSYDFDPQNTATLATPSLEVTEGNLVAIKVDLTEGEILKVTVNDVDTEFSYGYYVLMTPAVAGETYTVKVIFDEEEPALGTIVLPTLEGAVIESYDFNYPDFSTLETPSLTVAPGHFVAVKITTEKVITSVTINGTVVAPMNGYYTLMTPAVAGETYTVEVVLE